MVIFCLCSYDFNSHTREGVTKVLFGNVIGADFNSHTREGVTNSEGIMLPVVDFNSHTREGVTVAGDLPAPSPRHFNSHTREGVTSSCEISPLNFLFQLTHP